MVTLEEILVTLLVLEDIQCQRKGRQPAEPTSLPELVIPDEWKFTTDNKTFLIHESGVGIHVAGSLLGWTKRPLDS